MRGGALRETVRIEEESKTPDDRGGAEVAWTEAATVKASIDDQWARERVAASGLQAEGGTTMLIRYRTGIDAGMRAVIDRGPYAGTYNIRGVVVVKARGTGRPEALALACERGVAT